jgi:tRNA modification GTPase
VIQLQFADDRSAACALAPFQRSGRPPLTDDLNAVPLNRIFYGSWQGEDVVLIRTAASLWELHCHGGLAAIRRILDHLAIAGMQIATSAVSALPGTAPAVAASIPSASIPSDSQELTACIELAVRRSLLLCRTRTAADWVLRQLDGRLLRLLQRLQSDDSQQAFAARCELLQHERFTRLLLRPIQVGLFGPPNAGKSSLLNALCGRNRAIVSPVPGTTRDNVAAEIQVHGWALSISDTAGVHEHPDSPLESHGIRKSLAAVSECDVACILVPADQPTPDLIQLGQQFKDCPIRILVRSRCDLAADTSAPQPAFDEAFAAGFAAVVRTSAVAETGLEELRCAIVDAVLPCRPEPGDPLPLPGLVADAAHQGPQGAQ